MAGDEKGKWVPLEDFSPEDLEVSINILSFLGIETEEDLTRLAEVNEEQELDLLAVADLLKVGDDLALKIATLTVENQYIKSDGMNRIDAWVHWGNQYREAIGEEYTEYLRISRNELLSDI